MKCDICKTRDAVIHIQQVKGSNRTDLNFCLECANRFGIQANGSKLEMSFEDLAENIASLKNIAPNNLNMPQNISTKICPVCGTSFVDVIKNSQLGCPECYEIFKNQLRVIYEKNGLTGPYCGSMPHRLASFKSVTNDRIVLQNKLRESIESENYEKAALYRDRINALNDSRTSTDAFNQGGSDFE